MGLDRDRVATLLRLGSAGAIALVVAGCSDGGRNLIARQGRPSGVVEVAREVRPVVATTSEVRTPIRGARGCRIFVGCGVVSPGGAASWSVLGTRPSGDEVRLFSGRILPEDAWNDATIVLDEGIETLALQTHGLAAGSAVSWSQPLVSCPDRRAPSEFKNVILVSLDTLRADRVGVYSTRRSLTPNIDAVAREGMLFENAYSQFPNTLASHATMFTGYYPSQHGLVSGSDAKIGPDSETLARAFADRGYLTAAFTENAYVSAAFGFNVGFDTYHNGPNVTDDDLFPGQARVTFTRGIEWLERNHFTRFFLFLHTYEVHTPYNPSASRLRRFFKQMWAKYDGPYQFEYYPLTELAYNRRRIELTADDLNQIALLYDAEVSTVDDEVGRLVSAIDRLDLTDSTLLVLTSDHGDEFSEHGFMGHGETLHEHALHVPLVFRLPGVIPVGRRVKTTVGLVDLGPTVAELAGIGEIMVDAPGLSIGDVVLGKRDVLDRPVYSELNASLAACHEWKAGDFSVCAYDGIAVRDGTFSYIESAALGERRLFDVRDDPGETHDLVATKPEVARRYRDMARRFRESEHEGPGANPVPAKMDKSTEEKLRALGYIQ